MSVCDVPIISTVCDVAGEAAATVVAAPFDWLAQAMGGAAGWLIEAMWAVFDTTTLVDVTADGFTAVYNLIFGIGVFLVLIFFCLQLITGLIKRDPTALSRAALGAAKSVLGAFVVVTLSALALEIVDQLCVGIIQASALDFSRHFTSEASATYDKSFAVFLQLHAVGTWSVVITFCPCFRN